MFIRPKICTILFCNHQRIGKRKMKIEARLKKLPPAIPLDYTGNVLFQTCIGLKCMLLLEFGLAAKYD